MPLFSLLSRIEITVQPKDYVGQNGRRAKFTVEAKGEGLTYQWQYQSNGSWKNTAWLGSRSAMLQPTISSTNNGVKYRCVVTDKSGKSVTSGEAVLRMSRLGITDQPKNFAGASGTRACFEVKAKGDGLSYQWQYLSGSSWRNTAWQGCRTAKLQPTISEKTDGTKFRCVITDRYRCEITSSEATLTISEDNAHSLVHVRHHAAD